MATRIARHLGSSLVLSVALLAALLISALALAPRAEAFVYWTTAGGIGRADLDGSDPDPDFSSTGSSASDVAVDAGHIYWAAELGPAIGRANLDGTDSDPNFISDVGTPDGGIGLFLPDVTVDASHVYWTAFNIGLGGTVVDPRVGQANLDGSNPDPSFIPGPLAGSPLWTIAVDADHIYWTAGGAIGRANLDGTNPDPNFMTGVGAHGAAVFGVAVDAGHIYWTSYNDYTGAGWIGRANLDGSKPDKDFLTGAYTFVDLAVDADHLYWADTNGSIGRAKLDGSNPDPDFITDVGQPRGVAVDALTFPETTITSGPEGVTKNPSPSFAFSSDHPGATFECRLDGEAYAPCDSPKAYSDLADGSHRFKVRATSPDDQTDPSPASRKFTVDTKVRGEASARKAQEQSGAKIVVKAKVKAKEDLDAKATGKVKIRRRDGCLVGRKSEPKPCKVGFKLQRVNKSVGSGKKKTLKLKATDAGNRRLVKMVEKGRKATAKLKIELSDEAGNKETTKLKVKLKRAG